MSTTAVRVERLGKRYALTRGKAFWALRDVGFELERGEVLGIIGRNGAGKSTLLKILAGVTAPTTGRAELVGRVGSLLEVGTGFHPDLSGRENVFLAAALLGIPSAEVRRRFDEIVDYAGVTAFIDLPVKRYSSGMYMRLAYAVTALLTSDILLLDEVLAVGDAEFQKKTKQSVDAIAHDGRTVLFVSHSMASIKNLCSRCIWLEGGAIVSEGPAEDVADRYLKTVALPSSATTDLADLPARVDVRNHEGYYEMARPEGMIQWVETQASDGTPTRLFRTGDALRVRIGIAARGSADYCGVSFHTIDDVRVTATFSHAMTVPEDGVAECVIEDLRLSGGDYVLVIEAGRVAGGRLLPVDSVSDATQIRVRLGDYLGHPGLVRNQGHLAQRSAWHDDHAAVLEEARR